MNSDLRMWDHAVMICFNALSCNDLEGGHKKKKKTHTHAHKQKLWEAVTSYWGSTECMTTNRVWDNHTGLWSENHQLVQQNKNKVKVFKKTAWQVSGHAELCAMVYMK